MAPLVHYHCELLCTTVHYVTPVSFLCEMSRMSCMGMLSTMAVLHALLQLLHALLQPGMLSTMAAVACSVAAVACSVAARYP